MGELFNCVCMCLRERERERNAVILHYYVGWRHFQPLLDDSPKLLLHRMEWCTKAPWMLYAIMIISYVGDGFCQLVCFYDDMGDYIWRTVIWVPVYKVLLTFTIVGFSMSIPLWWNCLILIHCVRHTLFHFVLKLWHQLGSIVNIFNSHHKIWCTEDSEIPICPGSSVTVQHLSSATHRWLMAMNMTVWMEKEFCTAAHIGSWHSSLSNAGTTLLLFSMVWHDHSFLHAPLHNISVHFCYKELLLSPRKLSHFTSGSPTLTFALADACVLLWIYPLLHTSCTGTTVHYEIRLLLLLSSVGPDPATFFSSF